MLTGMKIAIIGGDARQLEVISKCIDMDASVYLFGFENLERQYIGAEKRSLTPDHLKGMDAVILPIVGTDDEGNVESIFTSEKLTLTDEHIIRLPKSAKIYTGMAKTYLKNLCQKHDKELVELLDLDDVAIYNSIPTAEGALMMAIQNTDITIHGSTSVVLGLGRVGFTMARVLDALGSKVRVGVRKQEHIARIVEMGMEPFELRDLQHQVKDIDLLFNTIPTMIVTSQIIAQMPHHSVIIDLASRPGGTDFRFAERRGVKALLAPGLPGIVAPKTAGIIIANTLARLILENRNQEERK
jgi:dipicolinate synthase subunit A